ncbi:MAG: MATE family efflux transporter, partial [Oscillospiraceae bacterium]
MNNKPIEKQFLKYVLPSMFSQLLASLYTIVDGLFIGVFIGDIGLGAINLAWPLAALVMATGIGIGTGGAVIVSNKMGA